MLTRVTPLLLITILAIAALSAVLLYLLMKPSRDRPSDQGGSATQLPMLVLSLLVPIGMFGAILASIVLFVS
ncbi:MAG TPA: hypothetical protein VFQ88_08640 [Nevskiaceae bacterium]|nr:hypothetical protein [Nevskiaceae bacterium]